MIEDRNFDDLAPRFARNIYGSMKGQIRLAVLNRDFQEYIPKLISEDQSKTPWRVLDTGAGQAQFSLNLAKSGCDLVLNDISEKMLAYAAENFEQYCKEGVLHPRQVKIVHSPLQSLRDHLPEDEQRFDLILCHAVLEWVADPKRFFENLLSYLKPGGYLSLIFYNFNGLAFKNLLRTNFHKFDFDNFKAFRGSLTPTHPQNPRRILQWCDEYNLNVLCKSGIRVFHDYILDPVMRNQNPEGILEKELEYSRREPFWEMARYIHYLVKK